MRRFYPLFCAVALLVGLLATPAVGRAEGPAATAAIEGGEAVVGQSLSLRVTIAGQEPAVIDVPVLPDWTVIPRGRAVGARGGDGQAVSAYRFELIPRREGELTFPALSVETGGSRLTTQALTVRVGPRPSPPPGLTGQDLFLDAVLSDDAPYLGQAVRYTVRLYRAVAATGVAIEPPAFAGFGVEALPGQRDGELRLGRKAYVIAAVDYLLTPLHTGNQRLGPPSARVSGLARAGGAAVVAGPERGLTVRPLPAYAGDAPFTGLVGRLELSSQLMPDASGNEAVYELTLSGRGNLEAAQAPALSLPPGLAARPLPPQGEEQATPSGLTGRRVFRYALTADAPGTYDLPPVRLAVFDPESGAYAVLEAAPRGFVVAPGRVAAAGASVAVPALHAMADGSLAGPPSWGWRLIWGLFPPLVYAATFLPRRRRLASRRGQALSPAQAAEGLRRVLVATNTWDPARRARATEVLAALDRLLYAGEPAAPQAVEAARREAVELLQGAGV